MVLSPLPPVWRWACWVSIKAPAGHWDHGTLPFWRISQRDLAAHGVSGCYGPLFVAVALQRLDINRPNGEARDIEQGGDAFVKERVGISGAAHLRHSFCIYRHRSGAHALYFCRPV